MLIERIASGGDGVGRLPDGMTVFVPRTVPDERVRVEIVERKRRFARGRLVAVESAGTGRVDPACPHYTEDACGGCQLQHLAVADQLRAKQQMVGDALRRIARRDVPDPAIVAAESPWHYRSKVTVTVAGGRAGFHRADRPGTVFDLTTCRIASRTLMTLWEQVRPALALLPDGATGVVLREDRSGRLHVVVRDGNPPFDARRFLEAVAQPHLTVWWRPMGGAARAVAGPNAGFPALAFAQIHPDMADRVRADAVHTLGALEGRTVWDLYCGVGDTARDLAARGATVWAVDSDRSAIEWAGQQASRSPIRYLRSRTEESLARLPPPAAVVVNPPRGGLHGLVASALERWAAARRGARLSYVSCDPATLARDLGRMPSLSIEGVTAYDLFPHTSHVETLVSLRAG